DAVAAYRKARDAWAEVVRVTNGVYRPDLTFGDLKSEHGHWADRLPAIEEDLASLERMYDAARRERPEASAGGSAVDVTVPASRGTRPRFDHTTPAPFVRGEEVALELVPVDPSFDGHVVCRYRHVNQGEDFVDAEMRWTGARFQAIVPGSYTDSDFALMYYFVV